MPRSAFFVPGNRRKFSQSLCRSCRLSDLCTFSVFLFSVSAAARASLSRTGYLAEELNASMPDA